MKTGKNLFVLALFLCFLALTIAMFMPTVRLSLFQEERELLRVAGISVTAGDFLLVFSVIASSATLALFLFTVFRKGGVD